MICARCGEDGAGLRYQGRYFCAKCWSAVRGQLTEDGVKRENGDAETTGRKPAAPANPLPAEAKSARQTGSHRVYGEPTRFGYPESSA